jgi:hypothetical protein
MELFLLYVRIGGIYMNIRKVKIIISIASGLMIWLFLCMGPALAGTLTSAKITTAPVIDGIPEALWDQASAMTVTTASGANTWGSTVTLKSAYTDDSVYFFAQLNDPTESLRRLPWQKQANGSWMKLQTATLAGGEDTYYEDKFAQLWNINIADFDATGCFVSCHEAQNPGVKAYGNMYTANTGETGDIWHMKMVRTNPTGYIDDQYIDSVQYTNDTPDAGRHSDPGGSPYYDNINAARNAPNYTSADQPAPPYWIYNDQKQSFNDTYQTNDEIAGIIISPPTGDRADIRGKAVYKDGMWTLEYGRKLTTGSKFDVQFSDLTKEYLFGTAIFENSQTRHSYESGVSKLVFAVAATPVMTTPAASSPTTAPAFEIVFAVAALLFAVLKRRR